MMMPLQVSSRRVLNCCLLLLSLLLVVVVVQTTTVVLAFTIPSISSIVSHNNNKYTTTSFLPKVKQTLASPSFLLLLKNEPSSSSWLLSRSNLMTLYAATSTMKRIPAELEDVPIPFIDPLNESSSGGGSSSSSSSSLKFIECYADCTAEINGIEYTIAIPCDYSVSLCYASENDPDELIPIEVTDIELMDDLFPIAESIVAEEYGEDLVLQRTPETLTLVGELELDDDEDDVDDDEEEDEGIDINDDDDDEEVDVLLSFEHRGKEYQLVRMRDPILLVGKKSSTADATTMETRLLLTKEESDEVMPTLEEMYLKYQNELDEEEEENDDVDVDAVVENKVSEDDDALAMEAMDGNNGDDDNEEFDFDDDDDYEDIVTFYDPQAAITNSLPTIDCYIDRVYEVDGVEYTIAVPCDYVVTICTTEEPKEDDDDDSDGELNPIDIEPDTTKIIDELFPIMAKAITDEFDGEMTLTRTPQYMTLVGDVDLDDDDDEDFDDDDDDDEEVDEEEEEEEVQVILTFDKDGTEYTLVRELEPMLLVGKTPQPDEINDVLTADMRVLLDAKESDAVVPKLMEMYNDDDEEEDDEE